MYAVHVSMFICICVLMSMNSKFAQRCCPVFVVQFVACLMRVLCVSLILGRGAKMHLLLNHHALCSLSVPIHFMLFLHLSDRTATGKFPHTDAIPVRQPQNVVVCI